MGDTLSTQQLRNLSFTLYAFDLRKGLDSLGQLESSKPSIWNQLTKFGHDFEIKALQELEQQMIKPSQREPRLRSNQHSLLSSPVTSIKFSTNRKTEDKDFHLSGSLAPYQISGDTDAVDFTLFFSDLVSLEQLSRMKLDRLLCSPTLHASLGQTWLLYAEVDTLRKDDYKLAKALIIHAFGRESAPSYCSEGKLLGCSVFEYSTITSDFACPGQVLVWLNHDELPKEIDSVLENLLYVLSARHKLLYTYGQARVCNRRARKIYNNLEQDVIQPFQEIAQAPDYLHQFQRILRTQLPQQAFQYAQCLRNLSDHLTTIATNLNNFNQKMELLDVSFDTELRFLQDFSALAESKYKKQIQIDIEYLRPGQALFQQITDTIRGLTELAQAERDRSLETTIQVLGVGLATSAIVSAGYGHFIKPWRRPASTNTLHPFIGYLLLSFVGAVTASTITYWFTKMKAKSSKFK